MDVPTAPPPTTRALTWVFMACDSLGVCGVWAIFISPANPCEIQPTQSRPKATFAALAGAKLSCGFPLPPLLACAAMQRQPKDRHERHEPKIRPAAR